MIKKQLSTESFVEEKQKETELTLYARVDSFDYFDKIQNYRRIIQLQANLGQYQNCRCRKEDYYKNAEKINEKSDFTFTVKTTGKKSKNLSIKTEYNFVVDEDFFQYFEDTANSRQIKNRYTFNIKDYPFMVLLQNGQEKEVYVPELLFELDIFEKQNGYRSSWVKIDIELDEAFKYIKNQYDDIQDIIMSVKLSKLPVLLKDGFIEKEATYSQKKMLDDLWRYEFKEFLHNKGSYEK